QLERDRLAATLRVQRSGKEIMTERRLIRRRTVEGLAHARAPMRQLIAKRRPHLQNGVGEAKLKDLTRDGGIRRMKGRIDHAPGLLATGRIGQIPYLLRKQCGELRRTLGTQDTQEHATLMTRRDALRGNRHWKR